MLIAVVVIVNVVNVVMEKAIQVRTAMIEKLKMRPAFSMRRVNRALTSLQLNLTRNSGYYALVSSVMCLCLVALKSDHAHHEEIDSELHYNFHAWDPAVGRAADPAAVHHPRERVTLKHRILIDYSSNRPHSRTASSRRQC